MRRLGSGAGIHVYRLFTRRLANEPAPEPAPGIAISLVSMEEMIDLCGTASAEMSAETVRAAFSRGEVCAAATDAGRLVGYCWFTRRAAPHFGGAWMDFDPRVVYTYRAFVVASHRGRRLVRSLYLAADQEFADQGCSRMLACIESHNRASARAAERAGFGPAGWLAYARWGQRLFLLRTPSVAQAGFRFYVPASRGSEGSK